MSRTIKTILVVGCGGLTSHILPALVTQFDLILVDGDRYEPKNTVRQLAAHVGDGKNKAETLAGIYQPLTDRKLSVIPHYVDENTALPEHDLMIVAVDNHDARLACRAHANRNYVPLIWGANETYDPQAFLMLPGTEGTWHDPFVRMAIMPDGRSPLSGCTTPQAVEDNPQLPIANNVAGGFVLAMLHALQTVGDDLNLPAAFIGTNTVIRTERFRELSLEKPATAAAEEIASKF